MTTRGDSALAQHDACWCATVSDDPKRKAEHLIDAGFDLAQVEPLDHDGAGTEKGVVCRAARTLELLDRQVVHADDFDAMLDQMFRARFGDADIVGVELWRTPQPRVPRLDEQPD